MQNKAMMRITTHLLEWLKNQGQILTVASADKRQRNCNPPVSPVGVQRGTAALGNSSAVSYKANPTLSTQQSHS